MSLVKATQNHIVTSKSVSGAAGKGMMVAGGGGLALMGLAAVIPFIGMFWLCVIMVGLGLFIAE